MSRIVFRRGEFRRYAVESEKLHIGGKIGTNIWKGDEIEFDGYTLRYDGAEHACPHIKGAIKMGWLVPSSNYDSSRVVEPQRAKIKVRPAQDAGQEANRKPRIITTVDNEERSVGNFRDIRERTEQAREPMTAEERRAQRPRHRGGAFEVDNDRQIVSYLNDPAPEPVQVRARQTPPRQAQREAPRQAPRVSMSQEPSGQRTEVTQGQEGVVAKRIGKPQYRTKVTQQTRAPRSENYAHLNRGVGID